MNNPLNQVLGGDCEMPVKAANCQDDSILGSLKRKQLRLTADLEAVNQAVSALEANPDLMKVLELVANARGR